jgi:hypothetical protein
MIKMRIEVKPLAPPMATRARSYDADRERHGIAKGMVKSWRDGMREGIMPDGAPLPVSALTGLPLGIGTGTIVDNWEANDEGKRSVAEPYQGERYYFAVQALVKRGVKYFSLQGPSYERLYALLEKAGKKLARTLEGGGS